MQLRAEGLKRLPQSFLCALAPHFGSRRGGHRRSFVGGRESAQLSVWGRSADIRCAVTAPAVNVWQGNLRLGCALARTSPSRARSGYRDPGARRSRRTIQGQRCLPCPPRGCCRCSSGGGSSRRSARRACGLGIEGRIACAGTRGSTVARAASGVYGRRDSSGSPLMLIKRGFRFL